MTRRYRYKSPPIEEAVCEFRFLPSEDWNLTVPGKLQARISEDYSGKPQEQRVIDVSLHTAGGQPPELKYGEGLAKVQLVTRDGKRKVGVGRDVLSIHMLRPYQNPARTDGGGWEEFRPRIEKALDAYWHVADPKGVSRIGVRYINKIEIPSSQFPVRIKNYLNCATPDVEGLPDNMNSYVCRAEYRYDSNTSLVLSHSTVSAPPEHLGFLLDIDVICRIDDPVELDVALEKTDLLRGIEREVFEVLITEKARELFDAD